jgi:hypothetical protein
MSGIADMASSRMSALSDQRSTTTDHHAIRLQDVCVKCTRTSKLVIRQVPVATSEPATPV